MFFQRFYDDRLAHASYLVGCQASGDAIVIDPSRDTAAYHATAQEQKLRIVAVTETHIHADYLSGTRQLAEETGARMYLSDEGGPDWTYGFVGPNDQLLKDGDIIKLGNLTLQALHTPGHTPEHLSFLLTDHPASSQPIGVFSGDFLFVGDVGRPDLLEKAAGMRDTMRKGAQQLYDSLEKFRNLPDHLQIWPAHGAGSACGKALGAMPQSVLGYEKLSNWALAKQTPEDFITEILNGQPEPPKYFAMMKKLNRQGPPLRPTKPAQVLLPSQLTDQLILDTRPPQEFAAGHLKNSIFLPPGSGTVSWAGWLLDYQQTLALVAGDQQQATAIVQALQSIGLDHVNAIVLSESLKAEPLIQSRRIQPQELDLNVQPIVDVRSQKEWEAGHLEQAQHQFLGYLQDHLAEISPNSVLYCQTGSRSLLASSLLERAGKPASDIIGGYPAIQAAQREKAPA
jgi:hydroxyacylglutathione hydrolase